MRYELHCYDPYVGRNTVYWFSTKEAAETAADHATKNGCSGTHKVKAVVSSTPGAMRGDQGAE